MLDWLPALLIAWPLLLFIPAGLFDACDEDMKGPIQQLLDREIARPLVDE